jgi:hypothetical protein
MTCSGFTSGPTPELLALLAVAAAGALVVLLGYTLSIQPGICNVRPTFRIGLAYRAALCWAVTTLCVYAGGFIMGRLYVPRA